ncbi:MAG: shikimate dehydrogenase [Candidatus Omnitrophota bacterium]|jgi:shikimate dehydrogenase
MSDIYGVLGFPVKHSFSPAMHNAAFKTLNLDAEYRLFEKESGELREFFASAARESIKGFNVTIPYKETAKQFIDVFTEEAMLIGAVNTVKIGARTITGHNTDGNGFLRHLSEVYRQNLKGLSVSLLGAGGAARAVAYSLSAAGVGRILIFDALKERAGVLSGEINRAFHAGLTSAAAGIGELQSCNPELFINATPVGMKEDDPLLINADKLFPCTFVYDVVYNIPETRLLRTAKARGCNCANGLGMLLYQGVQAFEFWTGRQAPVDVMRRALEEAVYGKGYGV